MTDRQFWGALKELIKETTKLVRFLRLRLEKEFAEDD